MCTCGLSVLTHEGASGEESTGDDERLTGEYDLLRSFGDSWGTLLGMSFTGDGNLLRSMLVIVNYEEVFSNVWSIGENSSFPSWLTGELVLILPTRGSCQLHGNISSQLMGGCLCCVLDLQESPSMILYFIGDLVDDLNSWGSFLNNF